MKIFNNSADLIQQFYNKSNIYIMGAGAVAHQLLHFTFINKLPDIKGVLVSNTKNNPKNLGAYPVLDFNKTEIEENASIILATMPNYWKELEELVANKKHNIEVIALSPELLDYLSYELLDNGMTARQPHAMLRFEVHLTEHCNLNCKGCSHFSPLAKEEFVDLEEYSNDLYQLSKLFNGEVEYIHLMGGEPLLNPNIEEIFDITRKAFPVGHLQLITNGILLSSMKDSFWENCQKNSIEIMPTRYPINISYDENIKKKAEKYNLHYQIYNMGDAQKSLYSFKLSEYGGEAIDYNFYRCEMANICINLSHGKLYPCVFPAYVHHLNDYFNTNFIVSTNDGVDIYTAKSGKEIMEKLSHPIPFCKYCKVREREYGIPYEISTKKRNEWVDY